MPQEMNVLCCYACKIYQVHIVKKSNKWQCKICGQKQCIQVVYFQGTGIDCRRHVQHLNSLKATEYGRSSFTLPTIDGYGLDCIANENDGNDNVDRCHCPKRLKRSSGKWSLFLESSDEHVRNDTPSDAENFDNSENSEFTDDRRKLRYSAKPSHSFPENRNCASGSSFQYELSTTGYCVGKSCSYPLSTRSMNILNKIEYEGCETENVDGSRKNDFTPVAASSSGKKLTGKWDKYLDVGKEERDKVCEDSSVATSSHGEAPREWDRHSDSEMDEQFSSSENDYSSCKNDHSSTARSRLVTKMNGILEEPEDGRESGEEDEDGLGEAPTNNSTAGIRQSTKCNIFEDYNDDLDLTIDF